MANAIPLSMKPEAQPEAPKAEVKGAAAAVDPRVVLMGDKKLPEGFVIPAKAKQVIVEANGTVRVDLGF